MSEVMVVTTPSLTGYEIVKVLGTVHGLTVRTRGVGGKIFAGIEGTAGGQWRDHLYRAPPCATSNARPAGHCGRRRASPLVRDRVQRGRCGVSL